MTRACKRDATRCASVNEYGLSGTLLYSTRKPHRMALGTLIAVRSPPLRSRRLLASKGRTCTISYWRIRSWDVQRGN